MAKGKAGRHVGIDLGGTKVYGVVMDGHDVRGDAKRKTPPGATPEAVVEAVVAVIDDLGGAGKVGAVGVGAPGAVDHATGVVRRAPNLAGFGPDVPLGAMLSEALGGVRVRVDNDVNVGALAEQRLGAGRSAGELVGIWVGTGVGGGLVLDGRVRRGDTGVAGEIGHTVVHPAGRTCSCGAPGHLEAYAGRGPLEREARERHSHGQPTALVDIAGDGRMTSSVWAKALAGGDAVTVELLDEAVVALGAAVASTVNLLDLALVVVGGGLGDKLGPAFVGRVEQAARESLFIRRSPLRVVPAELGDQAGAVGAALMAAAD